MAKLNIIQRSKEDLEKLEAMGFDLSPSDDQFLYPIRLYCPYCKELIGKFKTHEACEKYVNRPVSYQCWNCINYIYPFFNEETKQWEVE